MYFQTKLSSLYNSRPFACAKIMGSPSYPSISGQVSFYQTEYGVMVVADIIGLPQSGGSCPSDIFAFHIHEGAQCTGNDKDPFADTGSHYNPKNCPHPAHAGDLPPLFGNHGNAFMAVLTDRFTMRNVIGRTVIIHSLPDDFTTQPSGNAGKKIACGRILGLCQA